MSETNTPLDLVLYKRPGEWTDEMVEAVNQALSSGGCAMLWPSPAESLLPDKALVGEMRECLT